jgi:hypothetical protein
VEKWVDFISSMALDTFDLKYLECPTEAVRQLELRVDVQTAAIH